MTVNISTDAEIDRVRLTQQTAHPSSPASGYVQAYIISGSPHGGLFIKDSAGRQIGPFITGTPSVAGGVVTVVSDNFNRADSSTVGPPQIGKTPYEFSGNTIGAGDWGISSNQLYPEASVAENIILWETDIHSKHIAATLATLPANGGIMFNCRYLEDGVLSGWMLYRNGSTGYDLYTRSGVTYTLRSSGGIAPAANDVIDIYYDRGEIVTKVNGVTDITYIGLPYENTLGTMCGFRENSATTLRVDSFSVETYGALA